MPYVLPECYWNSPPANVLLALDSTPAGLSEEEIEKRQKIFGLNQLALKKKRRFLSDLGHKVANPLVALLLAASIISLLLGDLVNASLIASIVLFSLLLDLIQERHATNAADKLKASIALQCQVIRGGKSFQVATDAVVPGDIVHVASGDLIPADGILLKANDLFINQSALTGESFPEQKDPSPPAPGALSLLEAANGLFMGTSVISGEGTFVVTSTASNTILGGIAASLRALRPPTAFEAGIRQLGSLLMRIALFLIPLVVVINLIYGRHGLTSFTFAVALAVGLTPELLPMVVSIALSRGAVRMAQKKVIVKRLSAIEDLGAINVLCTDKTGTLTEAQMRLDHWIDPLGQPSQHTLTLAILNSAFQQGINNPIDEAILKKKANEIQEWEKEAEIPFDFDRRRLSVLLKNSSSFLMITKGAPESLLACCVDFEDANGVKSPLSSSLLTSINQLIDSFSSQGFRLLAVASKTLPSSSLTKEEEQGMTLAGFISFFAPPKESARDTLHLLKKSGVEVKILTGDGYQVSSHVCASLNMTISDPLSGSEIEQMTDSAFEARALKTNLFYRIAPAQKKRIIIALKTRGATVGFLGDGVNDAPALRSADVSLSFSTAVDAAQDAADIILLHPKSLRSLHSCVLEGRRTFANVMKYIMMAFSSNFGNMISMAIAVLFLPFLPMLPLQILLNNLLYSISQIPIPMDRVQTLQLIRPPSWNISSLRFFMTLAGPISSIFDFILLDLFRNSIMSVVKIRWLALGIKVSKVEVSGCSWACAHWSRIGYEKKGLISLPKIASSEGER
ncbi:MAG: magnesium-translocating P-type ATPase, partial [Verrucomicrobia bacterium]|nr:magnesium-translocating P-type ATPase [Verrucomicrobiota bacterium]